MSNWSSQVMDDRDSPLSMADVASIILVFSLFFFTIIGCFGNVNIIVATLRRRELQQKCGVLLAALAFCDAACLCFECWSGIRIVAGVAAMGKVRCFWIQTGYIFIENVEVYMILAVAIDRQLAMMKPISYRTWRTKPYIIYMIIPGVIYGLFYLLWALVTIRQARVEICNLPAAMDEHVSVVWNYTSTAACFLTVGCYVTTYIILYQMAPKYFRENQTQMLQQKRIVNTLSINVLGFFVSSVTSAVIILYFRKSGASEDTVIAAETYAAIPGLASYSINYYVYFWRSSEYRRSFCEQIGLDPDRFEGGKSMFGRNSIQVKPLQSRTTLSVM